MDRHEDSRYERTESDLRDAFHILAGKKELDKISVSEITKLTGITRSTFYNHYIDMPTFIDAMEDQVVQDLLTMVQEFHPNDQEDITNHFFLCLCQYIHDNPFLIRMFATAQASSLVEKTLDMLHTYVSNTLASSHRTGTDQKNYSYALSYTIGGVVGILHKWTAHHCDDSPEFMAECLSNAFLMGTKNLL